MSTAKLLGALRTVDAVAHHNLGALLCNVHKDHDGADYEFRAALRCDPSPACALRGRAALSAVRRVPSEVERAVPVELRVGLEIVLVGLASATLNGARGTIVSGFRDGRWGVQLSKSTKAIAVKTVNIAALKSHYR